MIASERTIPVGAIKSVSASKLKDDWFSLVVGSPSEPDPLINCVFKTEFFTHLSNVLRGVNLKIGETIEYNRKPGKLAVVKTAKDPAVARDDIYKSGMIRTGPGEPPNSVSKPTPRPRQVSARPVTKGKLVRPGAPDGGPSRLAATARSRQTPQAQPLPQTASRPQSVMQSRPMPQPVANVVSSGHQRSDSGASARRVPPPPPPPMEPPAPKKVTAKALYDFNSRGSNELSIKTGQIVEVMYKEGNGKFCLMYSWHISGN